MVSLFQQSALRLRLAVDRLLARFGLAEHAILIPLAVVIGVLTCGLAVAFHELIAWVRDGVYVHIVTPDVLYGVGVPLLILFPAIGGLVVGMFNHFFTRGRPGHGVVDVIETVLRGKGRINPLVALEKILTSAVTIGTGGSAGAEGPIVQIGAGVSSGVGQLLQMSRAHMPALIGCGTAAGISAIFGSPIGGVLFTLEVILLDFSIRAFTPIVLASVVAFVSTQQIFSLLHGAAHRPSIFQMQQVASQASLNWPAVPAVALLGIACGLVGVTLTLTMQRADVLFGRLKITGWLRPAVGGVALGIMGVLYVMVFGWLMLGQHKPFNFSAYPMPAFFGDGYGVIEQLLATGNATGFSGFRLVLLLTFLILAKIIGTSLTLGSGGSGGIIAPSLFLGAVTGALVGLIVQQLGWSAGLTPGYFALIGMGAVLAAVVHAPLASILILMEVTNQRDVVLPAMLACVVATGAARLIATDSIYSSALRRRGVLVGSGSDVALLRRITVDTLDLEPVHSFPISAPLADLLKSFREADAEFDRVLLDAAGQYAGMAVAEDVRTAILQDAVVPYLLVEDLARLDVPTVKTSDDLSVVFDAFGRHDVSRLPVVLPSSPGRVIGVISRKELMRRYHDALLGK